MKTLLYDEMVELAQFLRNKATMTMENISIAGWSAPKLKLTDLETGKASSTPVINLKLKCHVPELKEFKALDQDGLIVEVRFDNCSYGYPTKSLGTLTDVPLRPGRELLDTPDDTGRVSTSYGLYWFGVHTHGIRLRVPKPWVIGEFTEMLKEQDLVNEAETCLYARLDPAAAERKRCKEVFGEDVLARRDNLATLASKIARKAKAKRQR